MSKLKKSKIYFKKHAVIIASIMLCICMCGCGSSNNSEETNDDNQTAQNVATDMPAENQEPVGKVAQAPQITEINSSETVGQESEIQEPKVQEPQSEIKPSQTASIQITQKSVKVKKSKKAKGNNAKASGAENKSSKIGIKKAKKKALANAKVDKSDVKYTKAEFDYDDGIAIYDIEFHTSTHEYEYEINAITGVVHEKSIEKYRKSNLKSKNNLVSNSSDNNNSGKNNSGKNNSISVNEAKSIALKHAGYSSSEVTFKKSRLDYDDGRAVYEIEFYVGNNEYDYEIDARSGKIRDYDFDKDDSDDD